MVCSVHSTETNSPASAPRYETRAEHDPNGIGKFYLGREIARVMGHEAAGWLERPEREQEERTDLLIPALKLKPGDAVADIGAGTGYYTRRLAKAVGTNGLVFAVEIQPEMLDLLTNKLAGEKIFNVRPVLGTITDPRLPPGAVDLILMVDVYHEFDHPFEMVAAMCPALKPGGRIVFVEFRGEDPDVPIKLVHKMTEAQVRQEMSAQPLEWVETIATLPNSTSLCSERNPAAEPLRFGAQLTFLRTVSVPEGRWRIARRFNAGFGAQLHKSRRDGRKETVSKLPDFFLSP